MAGINLSQLNIPKSEEPVKRKHVIRLDELSDAYSNPEKKKEGSNNEPVGKAELKKPISKLEKLDKQLRNVEIKTDKLLEKAKNIEDRRSARNNQSTTTQSPVKSHSAATQIRRSVSFLTFQSMPSRKTPKQILSHIRQNAFINEGNWFSKIDSYDLALAVGKPPRDLQLAVKRLCEEGWFQILETSTSGYRILKINPEEYGLPKSNH